jgi:two-component system response regulator
MNAGPILLVEDSPDDAELILKTLQRADLPNPIILFADGEEALEWLFCMGPHLHRDTSRSPAFILLDLKLPKLSGSEVLSRLRSDPRTRCLPVVVLSSSSEDEDIRRCYVEGANSYVRKEISFDKLCDCVQLIGRYWTQVNECR